MNSSNVWLWGFILTLIFILYTFPLKIFLESCIESSGSGGHFTTKIAPACSLLEVQWDMCRVGNVNPFAVPRKDDLHVAYWIVRTPRAPVCIAKAQCGYCLSYGGQNTRRWLLSDQGPW